MLLGLGWPEWLTILGLIGGLVLTFRVMVRASAAYERARLRRGSIRESEKKRREQLQEVGKEER